MELQGRQQALLNLSIGHRILRLDVVRWASDTRSGTLVALGASIKTSKPVFRGSTSEHANATRTQTREARRLEHSVRSGSVDGNRDGENETSEGES